ncbi:MAG: PDZ domain-containing protein [Firmicutes bacterium]|nr:PDZ domain-containing protein [Bacillota bacterium]
MILKRKKGFSLLNVVLIICLTSIVSALTTGVIVTNEYKNNTGLSYEDLVEDESLQKFIEVYSMIMSDYYEKIDSEQMLNHAMESMFEYLGDSYTTYMDQEEKDALNDRLTSNYRGIGVEIRDREIVSVLKDTPAEKAGLQAGDVFVEIDGVDVTEYDQNKIALTIRENKNSSVKIKVLRNEEKLDFEIKLENLVENMVTSHMIENTSIGYIGFTVFSDKIGEQFKSAVESLETNGMKSLIIDLRGNTGGYLEGAEKIANIFLEKNKIIYSLENKKEKVTTYDTTDEKRDYKIVVIMNSQSASAAEVLAAALKDSYGATIVGSVSYGKGKVQQTMNLDDGGLAKYTTAKWLRPNGSCVDNEGIQPDYQVEIEYIVNEENEVTSSIDHQYNKALELLSTN